MILGLLGSLSARAEPTAADEIVARAVSRDPDVVAADAALQLALADRAAARFLRANPAVSASGGLGVPQLELSLTQPVSVSGEGRAARQEADASIRGAEQALARARLEAAAEARRTLCDAIASSLDADLARSAVDRAKEVREAVETQVAVGDAPDVDARLARLAEVAAVGEWLAAVQERDRTRVALLAAAGLRTDVELPEDPMAAAPAAGQLATSRSDVSSAEAVVDAAEAGVARARAAALPPLELGGWAQWQNVGVGPGPTVPPWADGNVGVTVGPTLTMQVPVWHRNEAGQAAAAGALAVAAAEAERIRWTADAEREVLAAQGVELDVVIGAMPALDPADAREAVASIERAYTEGQLSGLEVTLWLDRIGAAERAAVMARRQAAIQRIDRALAEEWTTLAP